MNEFIICSAVLFNGHPVCGRRHSDCYNIIEKLTDKSIKELKDKLPKSNLDNGFMTSHGRYVSRKDAWIIAKSENQIAYGFKASDNGEASILISENLFPEI